MNQGSYKSASSLGKVLTDLIAQRGWNQKQSLDQLEEVWQQVAGAQFAGTTRAGQLRNGVITILVANSSTMSELVSFHKGRILKEFQVRFPQNSIKELKFKLQSGIKKN
jgi:predicted nucleic acid-binding Zn ribbon protein